MNWVARLNINLNDLHTKLKILFGKNKLSKYLLVFISKSLYSIIKYFKLIQ